MTVLQNKSSPNGGSHIQYYLLSPCSRIPELSLPLGNSQECFILSHSPCLEPLLPEQITCAPFHERHVVEIGVPGQSCLHNVFGEMQLLEITTDK